MAAADRDAQVDLVALLWGPRAEARRGPKPTLTLETIARAGIAVADADGLAAVTMQRIAESLGVTKMALYRYVPGKVELVALMGEIGIGEPPRLGGPASDWRSVLAAWARELATRFQRHPWAMEVTVGARVMGPKELDWLELAVAALGETGLSGAEKLDVAATLAGHVRAMSEQRSATADGAPERSIAASITDLLQGRESRFPAILAAYKSMERSGGHDNAFEFGLDRILDGVESLVARRAAKAATTMNHEPHESRMEY